MAENTINIVIKMSGLGETFDFKVDPANTADQVINTILQTKSDLNKDSLTLVRKGRILKKDQVIKDAGVVEGETLHLVTKAVQSEEPAQPESQDATGDQENAGVPPFPFPGMFGGMPPMGGMGGMGGMGMPPMGMPSMGMPPMGMPPMGMPPMGGMGGGMFGINPEMISNILNNPMFQSMVSDMFSDPERIKGVLAANPMLSKMAEGNEEIQELINNPEKIKDAMKPEHMEQAIKKMQEGIEGAQNQSLPGGEHADDHKEETEEINPAGSAGLPPFPFPGMGGFGFPGGMPMGPPGFGFPGGMPPFDPSAISKMMEGFNLSGFSQNTGPQESYDDLTDEELKVKFSDQLEMMSNMGFTDEKENIKLLKENGGNAELALEKCFEKMGEL